MACRATFTFLKGPCSGSVCVHDFAAHATVAHMRRHLLHAHNAFDSDAQALVLVWEEKCVKLTDDAQLVSTLGTSCSITVNVVKNARAPPPPSSPPSVASTAAPAPAVTDGSRARIDGLQADPPLSALTGSTREAFVEAGGCRTVRLEGSAAAASCEAPTRDLEMLSDTDSAHANASSISALNRTVSHDAAGRDTPAASVSTQSAPPPAAAAASSELQQGARVLITGLRAKPEMNDCTGFICDAFNPLSERWTVQVDSSPPTCGSFRAVNLLRIPALPLATHWLDELGRQCAKSVDYSRQCPKGHALVPAPAAALQQPPVLCRLCHRLASPQLVCSTKSCCGGCVHQRCPQRVTIRACLTQHPGTLCVAAASAPSAAPLPRLHPATMSRRW